METLDSWGDEEKNTVETKDQETGRLELKQEGGDTGDAGIMTVSLFQMFFTSYKTQYCCQKIKTYC